MDTCGKYDPREYCHWTKEELQEARKRSAKYWTHLNYLLKICKNATENSKLIFKTQTA